MTGPDRATLTAQATRWRAEAADIRSRCESEALATLLDMVADAADLEQNDTYRLVRNSGKRWKG